MRELNSRFDVTRKSSVYSSKSVGFDGADFLNLVIEAHTDLAPAEVVQTLEEIHALAGRVRDSERFASREIDIDLLMYGQLCSNDRKLKLPRDDVLRYGFVLLPLAEIAPDLLHPESGRTMASYQAEMAAREVTTRVTELVM